MNKKIIFSLIVILILIVAVAGFFWWQESQKDVRELNKDLPEGVRVVKSFFGKEYKIINKIDGYEFGVPEEWKGIKKIEYFEEKEDAGGISIEGINGTLIGIGHYKLSRGNEDLESWVKEWSKNFGESFLWALERQKLNNIEIIKAKEEKQSLVKLLSFFFKKDFKIYEISGFSNDEDSFREIISNGKW